MKIKYLKKAAAYLVLSVLLLCVSAVSNAVIMTLDTTIRDFSASHDDFQSAKGGNGFFTGLVTNTLGPNGKPVYVGGQTLSSKENFDQWFNDRPGINISLENSLVATESTINPGVFTFSSNAYFPINGIGFGNEGYRHNYHFTTEIHTQFTYTGFGLGSDFTFKGDDDVWVYVNGELVIDLGGIHPKRTGSVDIDSLGLTEGSTYSLDIFHAERQTVGSNFSFTTAAKLTSTTVPEPSAFLMMVIGLALLGCLRRKQAI